MLAIQAARDSRLDSALGPPRCSLASAEVGRWELETQAAGRPGRSQAHLLDLRQSDEDSSRLLGRLSEVERKRAGSYPRTGDRERFICGRAFLRERLATMLDFPPAEINLEFEASGRPLPLRSGKVVVHFSIAYSGPFIALGFCQDGPIGVDIERIRPRVDGLQIAEQLFHPREHSALRALPKADRQKAFLRLWTMKEALLKVDGRGVVQSLDDPALPAEWFIHEPADPRLRPLDETGFGGPDHRVVNFEARTGLLMALAKLGQRG